MYSPRFFLLVMVMAVPALIQANTIPSTDDIPSTKHAPLLMGSSGYDDTDSCTGFADQRLRKTVESERIKGRTINHCIAMSTEDLAENRKDLDDIINNESRPGTLFMVYSPISQIHPNKPPKGVFNTDTAEIDDVTVKFTSRINLSKSQYLVAIPGETNHLIRLKYEKPWFASSSAAFHFHQDNALIGFELDVTDSRYIEYAIKGDCDESIGNSEDTGTPIGFELTNTRIITNKGGVTYDNSNCEGSIPDTPPFQLLGNRFVINNSGYVGEKAIDLNISSVSGNAAIINGNNSSTAHVHIRSHFKLVLGDETRVVLKNNTLDGNTEENEKRGIGFEIISESAGESAPTLVMENNRSLGQEEDLWIQGVLRLGLLNNMFFGLKVIEHNGPGKIIFNPTAAGSSYVTTEESLVCSSSGLPLSEAEGSVIFKQVRYGEENKLVPTGAFFSCPEEYIQTSTPAVSTATAGISSLINNSSNSGISYSHSNASDITDNNMRAILGGSAGGVALVTIVAVTVAFMKHKGCFGSGNTKGDSSIPLTGV